MRIARVIPLLRLPRGLHFFDYAIPETLSGVVVGSLVRIPFRAQKIDGVVIGIEEKKISSFQLKDILAVRTDSLLPSYWEPFTRAIEQDIGAPSSTILRIFLSIGVKEVKDALNQKLPAIGGEYDALRIGKNSLAAIARVVQEKKSPLLFIWHKNEERVVAYLKYIEKSLRHGSILVLFPQWNDVEAFLPYLPEKYKDELILVHSTLSSKEKRIAWQRIAQGKKRIIIGTRLALFTPIQDLKGIILDHEHAYGWKEEQSPRYDTRRCVELLQKTLNIPALFSSPSPSLERRHTLRSATIETPSPTDPSIVIADLRESFSAGHPYITETLREAITERDPNDRILLFHNRTGYAGSIACKDCGVVISCPNCALPFTHHKDTKDHDLLRCHHCFATKPVPLTCPSCHGTALTPQGKGNEQIEKTLRDLFPLYKNIVLQTYPALDALLWHTPEEKPIALIGFIDALSPLAIPDFKTLDNLYQVLAIARTIASHHHASIVLQTFSPEHALFDTLSFLAHELEERKKMRYPPFTRLIKCIAKDTDSEKAKKRLEELSFADVETSAVFPSHPPKRGKYYYWYRLLRAPYEQSLTALLKKIPSDILLDIDPETLL
ncbi:MAG: hypothetical protein Q7S16_05560 [bacterium]|nr:hypothetical protein [bacterium]